ncbi:MAG: thiamine diphosphokinase [Ahrensia sp.]
MTKDNFDGRYAVLLDGDVTGTPRLKKQMAGRSIIAADGGMRHAGAFDAVPVLWVGDFDSTDQDLKQAYVDVPRETHPAAKAASDGELAIARAIAMGASDIVVLGASGGNRTDHMLFNLLGLMALAQRVSARLWASSGREEFYPLVPGQGFDADFPAGTIFSVVGNNVSGLTIEGARWPLDNASVALGSTLTLSNLVQDRLSVNLSSGEALVIVQL